MFHSLQSRRSSCSAYSIVVPACTHFHYARCCSLRFVLWYVGFLFPLRLSTCIPLSGHFLDSIYIYFNLSSLLLSFSPITSAQNAVQAFHLTLFLRQKFLAGRQHQGRWFLCRQHQPHHILRNHHQHQQQRRRRPPTLPTTPTLPPPPTPPPLRLLTGRTTQTNLVLLQGWQTLPEQTIVS